MSQRGAYGYYQPEVDVIILLAGEGRRLLPLTRDRPKGLLCCEDGQSIFEHTVHSLNGCPWKIRILPVIGHGRVRMVETIAELKNETRFHCIYNPLYASTGPFLSLWLGLTCSKNDQVVVINGDTLIRETLLQEVVAWMDTEPVNNTPEIGVCVSNGDDFHPDDMKILLSRKGSFQKVGKDITAGEGVVKSAGVMSVKDRFSKKALQKMLNHLILKRETFQQNFHWHNILNEIKGTFSIDFIEVFGDSWHEVDTIIDLKSLKERKKQLFF